MAHGRAGGDDVGPRPALRVMDEPSGEEPMHGARDPDTTQACRCEEVLLAEVIAAIATGAVSVDDVKRRTRAGMGACQGIFCVPTIAAIIAQATGVPIERLAPMTARPPVRPILLVALAALGERDTNDRQDREGDAQ